MPKRKADRDGLYRREDSPYWWASYTDASGRRVRCSTGETDKAAARQALAKWIARQGTSTIEQVRLYTFDELMLAYMAEGRTIKDREKAANTLARDKTCISALYDHFSGWKILPEGLQSKDVVGNVIDGNAVFSYVKARRQAGISDGCIRREVCVLGAAITFANSRWGWGMVDPTKNRKPPQGEGRVRWITREEAARLIDVANEEPRSPYLADWIRLALHTGCRKGELLGLEWERVDLHQRVIHLEARHNKSKRRQTIPVNEEARNALISRARFRAQYCPSTPWVFADKAGQRIKDIKKGFASACRRAGITDLRPHDLRHTCASWLVMHNVPLATVKAVLRHSSIVVTERYAHLAPESARGALTLLDTAEVKPTSESKTAIASRSRHAGSVAGEKE